MMLASDGGFNMDSHVTKNTLRTTYGLAMFLAVALCLVLPLHAQVVTVSVQGRVYDTTGAAIPQPTVTVVNAATGLSRSATATAMGEYQIPSLPVGDYTVTAEKTGFQKSAKKLHLDVGAAATLDFDLAPGQVTQEVTVQEFRVVNSSYSTEFGRAVGGIVNIITKSGSNDFHGSAYEYFRNEKLDAGSILASSDPSTCATPGVLSSGGCTKLNKLRQNQYGFTLGGPVIKNRNFFFWYYEGQRRRESPYYNSIILNSIDAIQAFENGIGVPVDNLNVTRNTDYDNLLVRLDHSINEKNNLFIRYFFNSGNLKNYSPLNDGFDLPSSFKNNNDKDHSIVGNLSTTFTPSLVNELRIQYAHRNYDFATASSIPHMEIANQFTIGVNRGNPDFYREGRFELVDNLTKNVGKHTFSFGGDYNWVRTTESFPLFYPFEATFLCIAPDPNNPNCFSNLQDHIPVVFFFEGFRAPNFDETAFDPSVFQLSHYPDAVRSAAQGTLDHTY